MDIIAMLQDLVAKMSALQASLVDAQASLEVEKKASYDEGFAAGVASVPVVTGGGFTQEQVDAAVSAAIAPIQAELDGVKEELEAVKASLQPSIDQAVAACKADLLAKYKEMEVALQATEVGFEDLLK